MSLIGKFTVSVSSAHFEKSVTAFGKMSPYASIKIGNNEQRTNTHDKGDKCPIWDSEFEYLLGGEESFMKVTVWSKGTISDTFLGRADLSLTQLLAEQDRYIKHDLIHKKVVGQICISIKFRGTGGGRCSLTQISSDNVLLEALPDGSQSEQTNTERPKRASYVYPDLKAPPPSYTSHDESNAPKPSAPPPAEAPPPMMRQPSAPPPQLATKEDAFAQSKLRQLKTSSSFEGAAFVPPAIDDKTQDVFTPPSENPHTELFKAPNAKAHTEEIKINANVVKKSTAYGPSYLDDGTSFSDVPTLIKKVIIYNDGKFIYGIQVESRLGVPGLRHQRIQDPFGYSVLELAEDEYITEVKGGEEDKGLIYVEFFTNKGRKKHYGGPDDSLSCAFNVYIPSGNVVVGFHGSYGHLMHSMGVLSAPEI